MGSRAVTALAIDPHLPFTLFAATSEWGVYKSINSGGNWVPVNSGLADLHVLALALAPTIPPVLYAGTQSAGVFTSADGGATWTAMNQGLQDGEIDTLVIHPSNPSIVYAGTRLGIWTFSTAQPLPGDCDGDGSVSIGEVQKAINMFLGIQAIVCGVDCSGDGTISIGEVQKVINAFLGVASSC
jgi:hypothetical protein